MFKKILMGLFGIIAIIFIVFGRGISDECGGSYQEEELPSDNKVQTTVPANKLPQSVVIGRFHKYQIETFRRVEETVNCQAFMFGTSFMFYWFVQRKIKKIVPETVTWSDEVRRGVYASKDKFQEIRSLALEAHSSHVFEFSRYIALELLSLVVIGLNVVETNRMQEHNDKLLEVARFHSEYFTMTPYPELRCIRNQRSQLKLLTWILFYLYAFAVTASLVNIYNICKSLVRYLKGRFFVTPPSVRIKASMGHGNVNKDTDREEYVVPSFCEYLLLQHVKNGGNARLVYHVRRNIITKRRRNV